MKEKAIDLQRCLGGFGSPDLGMFQRCEIPDMLGLLDKALEDLIGMAVRDHGGWRKSPKEGQEDDPV